MPKPLKAKELNIIRGRSEECDITQLDADKLLAHIDALEALLDQGDEDDCFGTEGWRHAINIDE